MNAPKFVEVPLADWQQALAKHAALQQENAELRAALEELIYGMGLYRDAIMRPVDGFAAVVAKSEARSVVAARALLARHPAPRSDEKPDQHFIP